MATPFAFDSKAVLAQDLPGNHRGGRSRFCRWRLLLGKADRGICSTRIDFQLGTNAADTNGLNRRREVCLKKSAEVPVGKSRLSCQGAGLCPAIAQNPTVDPSVRASQDRPAARVARVYPQTLPKSAPKKRIDITASQVLVHINCAYCHPTVILASTGVGACNENLSQ